MNQPVDARFREAVAQYNAGAREAAAATCRRILSTDPDHVPATRMLAAILEVSGRTAESVRLLRPLLERYPEDADVLHALGTALARDGRLDEAIELLDRARRRHPDDSRILLAYGYCVAQVGRFREAARAYRNASRLEPADPAVHRGHGELLTRLARFDEAIGAYSKARELEPDDAVAPARLAHLYERTNRLDEMASVLSAALERHPSEPELLFLRAVHLRRRDAFEDALDLLVRLSGENLTPELARREAFEEARILDRLELYPRAFERAARGKRLARQAAERAGHDVDAYGDWLDRIHETFSEAWGRYPRPADTGANAPRDGDSPVFVLGFPRSGTTLIDSLLAVRDEFQIYEEKGFLGTLFRTLSEHGLSYPDCGDRLAPTVLAELRESYHRAVDECETRRPGSLIVDKDPLLTPAVPLLHQVFPSARYVFAVRHPLDVCLSCYMYDFPPASALADYATVEELAGIYAKVVTIWDLATKHLPLRAMELRYERLVDDLEAESKSLFEFLDVSWDDRVLGFARAARESDRPTLRNYDNIVRGLYRTSKYRWKHYDEQLAPALPALREAMNRFGYD